MRRGTRWGRSPRTLCGSGRGDSALGQAQVTQAGVAGVPGAGAQWCVVEGSLRLRVPRVGGPCGALLALARSLDSSCVGKERTEGYKQRSDMIYCMF